MELIPRFCFIFFKGKSGCIDKGNIGRIWFGVKGKQVASEQDAKTKHHSRKQKKYTDDEFNKSGDLLYTPRPPIYMVSS